MRTLKPESFTPHFRNLLREENPTWEDWELLRWSWNEGPVFCGKSLDTKEMDSRHPGGSAIGRMFFDMQVGHYRLTHPSRFHRAS
jgi:hypothetical protein